MSATHPSPLARQRGASIIAAVFLITAMAVIGALMARLSVNTNVSTVEEFLSAQALYAAETGVDWAAYHIANDTGTIPCAATVINNPAANAVGGNAWFTVSTAACLAVGGSEMYTITSTGFAGSPGNALVQRQIVVQFMP